MGVGRQSMTIKQTGEYLVAGELSRREYITTTFTGNVPEFDILAIDEQYKTIPVQVKTSRGPNSFPIALKDLQIKVTHLSDKRQQITKEKVINPNLIYVIVRLRSKTHPKDTFYICTKEQLQQATFEDYNEFLAKHNGLRPRKPDSEMNSTAFERLKAYEDDWDAIKIKSTKIDSLVVSSTQEA